MTESNNKALHNSFYASRSREIQSPVCISVKKRQVLKGKEVRGDAVWGKAVDKQSKEHREVDKSSSKGQ